MIPDCFDDIFALIGINNHEDDTGNSDLGFDDDNFLVEFVFEPEVSEGFPGVKFVGGGDPFASQTMGDFLWGMRGEDVGHKGKSHDDADKEEFFE